MRVPYIQAKTPSELVRDPLTNPVCTFVNYLATILC